MSADAIAAVNAAGSLAAIGIVLAITAVMALRLIRLYVRHERPPILLVRDALLFGLFTLLILGRFGREAAWVLLINALTLTALGVWLLIEVGLIGRREGDA